jgi:polyhydroxybutyrate depolymerase
MTPGDHSLVLEVDGRPRRALVHVPPGGPRPGPVVLLFHGAGATPEWMAGETGWSELADREGFVVVYPEGWRPDPSRPARFLANPPRWNDGSGRGGGADDVAFVRDLLDALGRQLPGGAARACVTGFSNGAGMAFRVAAELTERVIAVAPVAGHCWLPAPRPSRPVPTLYLVGTVDPLVPLEGGMVTSPWGLRLPRPPVRATLARWAEAIGCAAEPEEHGEDGIRRLSYGPGGRLTAYLIEGLGHHWPGGRGQLAPRIAGPPSDRLRGTEALGGFFRRAIAADSGPK